MQRVRRDGLRGHWYGISQSFSEANEEEAFRNFSVI